MSQNEDTPRQGSLRLPHNILAIPERATVPGSDVTCPAPDADSAASHQPHLHSSNQPATEATLSLPPFTPMAIPTFCWGKYEATHFIDLLNTTYKEAIHWKLNLFKIPYGTAGKAFTQELGRLIKAFAESSALESIALKAATIMPVLLLKQEFQSKGSY